MLREAKAHCDYLLVGLQTDPSIDRPDKSKPIQSVEERRIQLEGCRYVDEVKLYDTEADLLHMLQGAMIDVRIIGADWQGKEYTGHELDIPVVFNSRGHGFSSSELRKRIYRVEMIKNMKAWNRQWRGEQWKT